MLPTEFKLFSWGTNASDKGPVTLDREGWASIKVRRGDRSKVMIDLEHRSLNGIDADARGWGELDEREDGLWLTHVTWTPDGERRLADKTQVYISPAFNVDASDRIIEIVNVALCALPASLNLGPLVQFSRGKSIVDMKKLLEALGLEEGADPQVIKAALKAAMGHVVGGSGDEGEEAAEPAAPPSPDAALAKAEQLTADAEMSADELLAAVEAIEMANEEALAAVEALMVDEGYSVDEALAAVEELATEPEAMATEPEAMAAPDKPKAAKRSRSRSSDPLARRFVELSARTEKLERDSLMSKYGKRLSRSMREYCETQPVSVLRSLLPRLARESVATRSTHRKPTASQPKQSQWSKDDMLAATQVAAATGATVESVLERMAKFNERRAAKGV